MRIRNNGGLVELRFLPGLHWLLGSLFAGVGALFVAGPLGLFNNAGDLRWSIRLLIAALGATHTTVGLWMLTRSPLVHLTVDRLEGVLRLEHRGLMGRQIREWPTSALAAVQLAEKKDSEDSPVFQLQLVFKEAGTVPVSPVWSSSRGEIERAARALADATESETVNVGVTD